MSIFDVPISELHEPNELAHFGVKGMKWGRRKRPSRAERRRLKAVERQARKDNDRAADAYIRNLSRSKISPKLARRKRGYVDDYYYGNKPEVTRLDRALLRAPKGSRRAAYGRARVIRRQRRRAGYVDPMLAWQDPRTGPPTQEKVIFGAARGDAAWRIKKRAGGTLREYRRQREIQKKGLTYQKAEPQPWNPKFVGSRINRKYLGKF